MYAHYSNGIAKLRRYAARFIAALLHALKLRDKAVKPAVAVLLIGGCKVA